MPVYISLQSKLEEKSIHETDDFKLSLSVICIYISVLITKNIIFAAIYLLTHHT